MKVTIDIDCTPLEARQFFGLPDVQPMQEAVMQAMEQRLLKEMENYSPEKLFETWMPLVSANREMLGSFFSAFTKGAAASSTKDKGK